ncbi:hypothetical protein [Bacillus sp. TL12]|nr:hypothetical protein [Bacillus sp. TL12]MCI0768548.1 hypothetical protein [Bacillus sp. TL12]
MEVLLQSFRRYKEMGNVVDQFYETINNSCNALYVEKTKFGVNCTPIVGH